MRDVVGLMDRDVEVSGLEEVGTFTIQANAKAFKILIDGLYSDKIRAIIRELWANAFDSHCMAGIAHRPFFSRLPTRFDTTFSVRDFGVSLTHEQVMKLYTTVFASTKEDTNAQVGKFGLGSKTPFAYTDSFSVVAILDGEKRTYNAYIDSKGIPRIALFSREETDEEQGLEISFSVKDSDIKAFSRAAQRVALGFDVIPETNGVITKTELTTVFEGNGWRVVTPDWNTGLNGALVRQGCVLYPVDRQALTAVKHSAAVDSLAGETVILDMPIGSVDITPSRESLSYDPITAGNLIAKFEEIAQEFLRQAEDKISNSKTWLEAIRNRVDVLGAISSEKMKEFISQRLAWRGRTIPVHINITSKQLQLLRLKGVNLHDIKSERKRGGGYKYYAMACSNFSSVPHKLPTFVYAEGDSPRHLGPRLAAARHAHGDVYYIPNFKLGSWGHKAILAMLGRPDDEDVKFVDIETFPYVKPDYKKTLASLTQWDSSRDAFAPPRVEIEPDQENVFYVHTFKGDPRHGERYVSLRILAQVWDGLAGAKLLPSDAVLVGIPASRKDIANNIPESWASFFDWVSEVIAEKFDAEVASKAMAANTIKGERDQGNRKIITVLDSLRPHASLLTHGDSFARTVLEETALYGETVPDGPFQLSLVELIRALFMATESDAILSKIDEKPHTAGFYKLLKAFNKAYPIVRVIAMASGYYNTPNLAHDEVLEVFDYLNFKDAQAAQARQDDVAWG
jgi:hypothetical protein